MSGIAADRIVQGQEHPVPGVLIISGTKLSWSPKGGGESFAVAVQAITGSLQKSKARPQMRISTISGPLVLAFSSMDERDSVVNKLQALRNSFSEKKLTEPGGPQAEIKKQLLQEDSDLRDIYNALVKDGVISDAEFWKPRQDLVARRQAEGGGKQQTLGLRSALLAQLQPSADGKGKQVSMSITQQFIQQVFAEKPHVHRAFLENVPQSMSDKEFWTRFAKHEIQMQHWGKTKSRMHDPPDPLFSRLTQSEAAVMDNHRVDPTLNLNIDQYDRREAASSKEALPHGKGETIAKDMNRHSAVVLEGPGALEEADKKSSEATAAFASAEEERQQRNRSDLEDLRGQDMPVLEKLEIHNPRRYYEKSGQGNRDVDMTEARSMADLVDDLQANRPSRGLDPAQAEQVLLEIQQLCESSTAYTFASSMMPASLVPRLQTHLRQNALVCNELLRQFWGNIPLQASVTRERSATKLQEILGKKYTELENFKSAAEPAEKQVVSQFLQPIFRAIDAALNAYQLEMSPVNR